MQATCPPHLPPSQKKTDWRALETGAQELAAAASHKSRRRDQSGERESEEGGCGAMGQSQGREGVKG